MADGRDLQSTGRVPPYNLEAERSLLGALFLNPESIHAAVEAGVSDVDFFHEPHQKIFSVLLSLSELNAPFDFVTVANKLRDRGWHEAVGGQAFLTTLIEDPFTVASVPQYAKIIREKALLRRMIQTCTEIVSQAYAGIEDIDAFLDESESQLLSVADLKLTKTFSKMTDVLAETSQAIEDAYARKSAVAGISTGFHKFDQITSGLHPGQLIVIGGRPAMGKTSLALQMAQHAALQHQAVVAVFSLEMREQELMLRLVSGQSRIDSKRLRTGKLQEQDFRRLANAFQILGTARIFIDQTPSISAMDVRARCRRLKSVEKKLDLVVIDYLQLMRAARASTRYEANREREVADISRALKGLAKELNVPVIALAQLSRNLESRPDKRPLLSDIRESGAIEQDADVVAFVYRDEVYNKETEDKEVAELIIAKHRAGETGTIRLRWMGRFTSFENMAEDSVGTPVGRPDIVI